MNFLILAAGKGSRFNNTIINKPKSLIEINGISLIENIINCAIKNKIKNINIVTGYKSEKIKKIVKKKYKKVNFIHNKNFNKTEMLYSLIMGLKQINDDVIVSYADIYYNYNLINKINQNIDKKNLYLPILKNWRKTWSIRKKDIFADGETLSITKSFFLKEIGQKISNNIPKYQFMGLLYIPKKQIKKFISLYRSNKKFRSVHLTYFLNSLIINGFKIKCLPYNGKWFEFDDKEDLSNFINY
tara:strand:- start:324 stop:1052 length:729 start_codon:yes stop_codon:yes gene_type:complete